MSLHVTTALAAGVFALMFHDLSGPPALPVFNSPFAKGCLVSVIDLYAVLQLLILAHYLFHTFETKASRLAPRELELIESHVRAIDETLLQRLRPPSPSEAGLTKNVKRFQPVIIYFSALSGIVASLGFALCLFSQPVCCLRWFFVIIPIPLFLALLWMYRAHKLMDRLAEGSVWNDIQQERHPGQSTGAQLEGQG